MIVSCLPHTRLPSGPIKCSSISCTAPATPRTTQSSTTYHGVWRGETTDYACCHTALPILLPLALPYTLHTPLASHSMHVFATKLLVITCVWPSSPTSVPPYTAFHTSLVHSPCSSVTTLTEWSASSSVSAPGRYVRRSEIVSARAQYTYSLTSCSWPWS